MPRPGQPGSLDVFTGNDISNYLDDYNAECQIYVVKPAQRVLLFPRFCTPEIKEIVMLLPGYESPSDWELLQTEIKKLYWQFDHPKHSVAALDALIRSSNSNSIPLPVYLLKFTSITDALVARSLLSPVNRVVKLLEGLDDTMRMKVIKFCMRKDWKVTDQDTGETPNFDEIKKFLEHEVLTMDRIWVYEREHCFRATSLDPIPAISHSSNPPAVPSPKPAIPANPANLATSNSIPSAPAATVTSAPAPISAIPTIPASSSRRVPRVLRCIWCDSRDHTRRSECSLFIDAMKTGNIRINKYGRVAFSSTAAEIPPAFGRGGMKSMYDTVFPVKSTPPSRGLLRFYTYDDRIST
jgi:hypothetical protein